MKRVCIHQPDFVPYLGFFHRLLLVDLYIIFDDVQFLRRGWHHRDKIKTKYGEAWLTLSIQKGLQDQKINETLLSTQSAWIESNLNLLVENYRSAAYFDEYFPRVSGIYQSGYTNMIDINLAFIHFFLDVFEIHVETLLSSKIYSLGQNNQRLVSLLKAVGGTHYLTGTGSRAYLDEQIFIDNGIVVEWQEFPPPVYPQLHGAFIPHLSCLDVLFNCGPGAKDVLRSCLVAK